MRNYIYKFGLKNPSSLKLLLLVNLVVFLLITKLHASEQTIQEMFIGNKDAPVTLIEYASFTCPHCAEFHLNVMPLIKNEFIDSGKLKLIYREIYFDGPGLWAGLLARCKGAGKYFGMVSLLYNKQESWAKGNKPQDFIDGLLSVGRQAGISDEDSMACMRNDNKAEELVKLFQSNSLEDNITSTPSLVLNGVLLQNIPYEELNEKIKKLLR